MRASVQGEQAHIELSPAELHVVHCALHSYGDHVLADTLKRDAQRMSVEFRQQLAKVRRSAKTAADALDAECARAFDHADGKVRYRPTCHYAYHPCDDAVLSLHEMAGAAWQRQPAWKILDEHEIVDGIDELGVLLYGHAKNAYWYGSQLTIEEARELVPHNNATSLQVTVAVLAGLVWALENPRRGVVEPEDLDHARIMQLAEPYLGTMHGEYGDWTPLWRRGTLFPEDLDESDPWQFKNVRVV
jgi:homospermidine synthase